MLGADCNDRLMTAASDGGPLLQAPVPLSRTSVSAMPAAQAAALRELLPPPADAGLWAALAPSTDAALPGELLRELRAAGYGVQGFADRAALLAAWLPECPSLVLLEMTRRQFSISLAVRDAEAGVLRRHVPLPGGEHALHDAWLKLAAATLVQQTRFDPLHDLRHEAALREQIPQLAADAQQAGQARCAVDTGQGTVTLALTRDQFASAARPVLAPLDQALQALSAAHGDATLLVPRAVAGIPGIGSVLAAAHFANLCMGDDGLAARAASLLAPSGVAGDGGVPYYNRVPLLPAAPKDALQPIDAHAGESRAMATHVVWRGRVVPITATGLVLGRDPGGAGVLQLPEGLAGLSRRHCTLRRDGGRSQVIDHSSHGTFLDGARVRGRALLPAGGVLRLGEPGIELPLVAIEG